MPTVWLSSPAWRRLAVSRLVFAQRAHLVTELAARGLEAHCVVVADDENLDIARGFGFETVEMDNSFLGRRFNAGIRYALDHGADYIVHVGSDDWVHPSCFDRLPLDDPPMPLPRPGKPVVWRKGPELVVTRRIGVVDLIGGRLARCRARGDFGIVPWIFPRALLDTTRLRPGPIRADAQRGIDHGLVRGLHIRPKIVMHDPGPLAAVDFKSAVNLTDFAGLAARLAGGHTEAPWPALAEHYPAELVELARRTHQDMAALAA